MIAVRRKPGLLPNAPNPVLANGMNLNTVQAPPVNMPELQFRDQSGQIFSQAKQALKQPTLDMSAVASAGRAGEAFGAALQTIGNVANQIAAKRQQAKDIIGKDNASTAMDVELAEFQAWRDQNPNEDGWAAEWAKRLEKLTGKISQTEGISASAAKEIASNFGRFSQLTTIGVKRDAFKKTASTADALLAVKAAKAADEGNESGLSEYQTKRLALGYKSKGDLDLEFESDFTPRLIAAKAKNFDETLRMHRATGNEAGYLQALENPPVPVSPEMKEAMKAEGLAYFAAKREQDSNKRAADFHSSRLLDIANGRMPTIMQVNQWAASGELSADDAARMIASLKTEQGRKEWEKGAAPDLWSEFITKTLSYDPDDDPDFSRIAHLQARAAELAGGNKAQALQFTDVLNASIKRNANAEGRSESAALTWARNEIEKMGKEGFGVSIESSANVLDANLLGALGDRKKLEKFGIGEGEAEDIAEKMEDGETAAAFRAFRLASSAAPTAYEKKEGGLTEWEWNLFKRASKADTDAMLKEINPERQRQSLFKASEVSDKLNVFWWQFKEDNKRAPNSAEIKKWLNDELRAVSDGKEWKEVNPLVPAASADLDEDTVSMVKGFEGFIPKAYGDFKQTSVGYGTRAKTADEELTEDEADKRLRAELMDHSKRVTDLSKQHGVILNQKQKASLISFDFNTGMVHRLFERAGSDKAKYGEIMKEFKFAGGEVKEGLVKRRAAEASYF